METRLVAALAANPKSAAENLKSENGTAASEETGEESVEAASSGESGQNNRVDVAPPPPDEEGFVWPEGSAPAEAASVSVPEAENEPAANTPLPKLDELVQRIPPSVRETLDELFRAKFVGVKRADRGALKN